MDTRTTGSNRNLRRELVIFLIVVAALGMTGGILETTFNNFLSDTFDIAADERGRLEFPRELPGFLVAIMGGALFFLSENRLAVFSALMAAAGIAGLSISGDNYHLVIASMIIWSAGNHMLMPVNNTIALSLAPPQRRAEKMGQIGAVGMAATIVGASLVWVGLEYLDVRYRTVFAVGACGALVAAIFLSRLSPLPARSERRPKLVLRRKYSLYYLLNVFSGARKQVFITFGPWVLIKVFGEPAPTIAKLWVVASAIGVVVQPQLGKMIDRYGERVVLAVDAGLMVAVCLGYGFAESLPLAQPVRLVYVCYVLDNVMFAAGIARATYLDKIAESEEDVHASLSVGVSIDHAVSMSIPALGGLVWVVYGFPYVFLCAAAIAFCNLFAALSIRVPARGSMRG